MTLLTAVISWVFFTHFCVVILVPQKRHWLREVWVDLFLERDEYLIHPLDPNWMNRQFFLSESKTNCVFLIFHGDSVHLDQVIEWQVTSIPEDEQWRQKNHRVRTGDNTDAEALVSSTSHAAAFRFPFHCYVSRRTYLKTAVRDGLVDIILSFHKETSSDKISSIVSLDDLVEFFWSLLYLVLLCCKFHIPKGPRTGSTLTSFDLLCRLDDVRWKSFTTYLKSRNSFQGTVKIYKWNKQEKRIEYSIECKT